MNKLTQRMATLETRLVPKQVIDHSSWVLPDDDKRDIKAINGRHWGYVDDESK
jgi:hypothetical protein